MREHDSWGLGCLRHLAVFNVNLSSNCLWIIGYWLIPVGCVESKLIWDDGSGSVGGLGGVQ